MLFADFAVVWWIPMISLWLDSMGKLMGVK